MAFGLTEGSSNLHLGQGTANRRFFFYNAMLELLWVRDEREARSPPIAPTRLWKRWRYRFSGYSPFGVCLRAMVQHAVAGPAGAAFRDVGVPPALPAARIAHRCRHRDSRKRAAGVRYSI